MTLLLDCGKQAKICNEYQIRYNIVCNKPHSEILMQTTIQR